jgi:hypothetical protein
VLVNGCGDDVSTRGSSCGGLDKDGHVELTALLQQNDFKEAMLVSFYSSTFVGLKAVEAKGGVQR